MYSCEIDIHKKLKGCLQDFLSIEKNLKQNPDLLKEFFSSILNKKVTQAEILQDSITDTITDDVYFLAKINNSRIVCIQFVPKEK